MALNFMEIASDFKNKKLSYDDPKVKEAEKLISDLASTQDGRAELAEVIGIYLQRSMNFIDIAPMISNNKHFSYGEKPEFRLKKKGVKAFWIAPNSSTPKSRNYDTVLSMDFETLSVRPTCLKDDLTTGRLQSLMELLTDAQEALRFAIADKIFTLLGQVYNETNNKDNYFVDTTKLTADSLKKAIRRVKYKRGGTPVILGDEMLINEIADFEGFAPAIQEEVQRTGQIGTFYGARIMSTTEVFDEANDRVIMPKNRLYIITDKIGYSATYGDNKAGQEESIEDWTWNARIDMEWGFTVTDPEAMAVVEVK